MKKECLIIDDVDVSRYAALLALETLGYSVVEARDEDEAQRCLKKSLPTVILMDWHLRKNSGIDFMKVLQNDPQTRAIPVIIFSGVEEADAENIARDAGAAGFIRKPTTQDKIETTFHSLRLL